jgi:hypothetical protein
MTAHRVVRKSCQRPVQKSENILKHLKKTADYLFSVKESVSCGESHAEIMKELEAISGTITKILGKKHEKVKGSAQSFKKFYVHRDGTAKVELLAPVDVFPAIRSVERKTFGFIRKKGEDFPLQYAISGKKQSLKDNPKVINNEEWARISLEYGKRNDFDSKSNGWERSQKRGDEKGTDFAAHTERLLMLWFSIEMLRTLETDGKPLERLLKRLHNVQKMRPRVTAEILLNREPCGNCREFQDMISTVTGIKFEFTIIPTLGSLSLTRDQNGNAFFPIKSTKVLEDHEDEEDYAIQVQTASTSKCQVVIPVRSDGPRIKPTIPKTTKHHHRQRHHHDEDSSIISVKTHVTIGKSKRLLQSYAYQMSSTNLEAVRQRAQILDESESDDDEDFVPRTPIKTLDSQTRKTTRFGLSTPDTTPFAPEAVLAAKKIRDEKKRRLRERDSSPSVGRKHKRSKFE